MTDPRPYPKRAQLHRPARRRARITATKAQWAEIAAAKLGPCRVCCDPGHNGSQFGRIQLHHLVSRSQLGDDVADNIVPLCLRCHESVTLRRSEALMLLVESLSEDEVLYCVRMLGKDAALRLFGVPGGSAATESDPS